MRDELCAGVCGAFDTNLGEYVLNCVINSTVRYRCQILSSRLFFDIRGPEGMSDGISIFVLRVIYDELNHDDSAILIKKCKRLENCLALWSAVAATHRERGAVMKHFWRKCQPLSWSPCASRYFFALPRTR